MGHEGQPDHSGEPDDGEDRQKTSKALKGFLSVVLQRIWGRGPAGGRSLPLVPLPLSLKMKDPIKIELCAESEKRITKAVTN